MTSIKGIELTAAVGPVPDWGARSTLFYIQVNDIEATLTKIVSLGGKAVMPRTEGPDFGSRHILVFA